MLAAKGRCGFGEETFAGIRGNGRVAPIPVVQWTAIEPRQSTRSRRSLRATAMARKRPKLPFMLSHIASAQRADYPAKSRENPADDLGDPRPNRLRAAQCGTTAIPVLEMLIQTVAPAQCGSDVPRSIANNTPIAHSTVYSMCVPR